jgi:UDP-N-acetylmuramate--alanine ligase
MAKHYHLIGIGGIGMSGIAQLLLRCGLTVSGSDLKENKNIEELRSQGAQIFIGHARSNLKSGTDVVVWSSAIKDTNPEIIEAKEKGIVLLRRAEALAELMRRKTVITVSGSHGKTTTTSLASYLLLEAGLDPTVAIGGILRNIGSNACLGSGEFFVAEADESDGSFLCYRPKYSIITNVDREHLDYYGDFKKELDTFSSFINSTEKDGCLFCCADDANLMSILKDYKRRYILFGLQENAHIYPKNIELKELTSQFDCIHKNKFLDRFHLALGGAHNISNALSVIALGLELGISLHFIKKTLSDYKGAKRRLEVKFDSRDFLIIDDYAHHPTEIKATLQAARHLKSKRLVVIFQPHRYSRTRLLLDEFAKSFDAADYIIVTDIYAAGEAVIEGVNAKCIVDKIKGWTPGKEVVYLPKEEILEYLLKFMQPQDLIMTLGAGDIVRVSDELAKRIKG